MLHIRFHSGVLGRLLKSQAAFLGLLLCLAPAPGLTETLTDSDIAAQLAEAPPVINSTDEPAIDPADEPDANLGHIQAGQPRASG
jgi:hypothetical protein